MEPQVLAVGVTLSIAAITGLSAWVFKMNAEVQVLKEKARVTESNLVKNTEVLEQIAGAINDLKVVIEGMKSK